ncbi:macro domain-containing protein [Streptomyces panaciradicis]|uniref:macro domain-containing protein n=1 Tax=Streptomyces panaciradicis TaxID=1470261 RepID=UPI00201CC22D|nr:Appr-1-p processing protein [Streptomyces panaciradicis]MCL6671551.1 Appr-1-p processing protein [Streptomyces panaciradicis]
MGLAQRPAAPSELPLHHQLVAELRALRKVGIPRVREIAHPGLTAAATAAGLPTGPMEPAAGIERLLMTAVRWLDRSCPPSGDQSLPDAVEPVGELARAAALSFGLVATGSQTAGDRRRAAAAVFGVTTESFRHRQEHQVLDRLADAVLALAGAGAAADGNTERCGSAPDLPPRTPRMTDPPTHFDMTTPGDPPAHPHIQVHLSPIELLRGIDVLVSSENTYLEMSKIFRDTVSGALRRAAAVRNEANAVVDDPLARELRDWLARHNHGGIQVPPGTVVPTGPGAMAERGVRRVLHAAVAVPRRDGRGYETSERTVVDAVAGVFRTAAREREAYDPPLSSLCFPVLGAGRGGLPPERAARWLRWAVEEELRADPRWTVHLVTRTPALIPVLRAADQC